MMSEPVLKLYEISAEYDRIAEQIIENGGELTPELEAELSEIEGAFEEKAERVALYVRNLLASAKVYEEEISRLEGKQDALLASAKSLKAYLKRNMEKLKLTKIPGKLATVAIQKNSQPSVRCDFDQDALAGLEVVASHLVNTAYSLNRKAVVDLHKKGGDLPEGITVERSTHLRIR